MVAQAFNSLAQFPDLTARFTTGLSALGHTGGNWDTLLHNLDPARNRANSFVNDYVGMQDSANLIDTTNRFVTGDAGLSDFGNKYVDFGQGYGGGVGAQQGFGGMQGAQAGIAGGQWAALDAHNAEINNAAAKFGAPANLLKAMINRESSGNWERDNYVYGGYRGDQMLPFVGIFKKTADS